MQKHSAAARSLSDSASCAFVKEIANSHFWGVPIKFNGNLSAVAWGFIETGKRYHHCNIMVNMAGRGMSDAQVRAIAPFIAINVTYLCSHASSPLAIGIDVSRNLLTDHGLHALCSMAADLFTSRVAYVSTLKAHNNMISDQGAAYVAALAVHQGNALLEEIHISHNRITDVGASFLTCAEVSGQYNLEKGNEKPLWLRMDHNKVSKKFIPGGSWCPAIQGVCNPRSCNCMGGGVQLHLPYLYTEAV